MNNKTIVVGITGGIAAYKTIEVISRLRKLGYDVYVILSKNASYFVTQLTLETISNNPVVVDMFDRETSWEVEHISLAQKADLFLVAPATANVIGKIANGIADDMLTTTFMACTAPKLVAPAMNTNMYENSVMQNNINKLHDLGYEFVGPDSGILACGDVGVGRMSEPEAIVEKCHEILSRKDELKGKKIVVTAGPTIEPIDPVRFITNHSTGKMGYAIAKAAYNRGADVVLVSGKTHLSCPAGVKKIDVTTTVDMLEAVTKEYDDAFAVIKAAAPSDYKIAEYSNKKIKKDAGEFELKLISNPDIAKTLGEKKDKQKLIIFAAETNDTIDNAIKKCKKKNADMVVANDVTKKGAGFGTDTNIVSFVYPDGKVVNLEKMTKEKVANAIIDSLVKDL